MSQLNDTSFTLRARRGTAANLALSTTYLVEGEFAYTTDTKQLNIGDGTNKLRVPTCDSSGNLGIGTTTPTENLDVADNAILRGNGTNTYLDLLNPGVAHWYVGIRNSTDRFQINRALLDDSPFLAITSSGNVGIGTTSPGSQLQVNAGSASTIGQIIKGAASQTANLQEWQDSLGNALTLIDATGRLLVGGTTFTGFSQSAEIRGTKITNYGQLMIYDSASMTTGVGGMIGLGGKYDSGGSVAPGTLLQSRKTNSTSGDWSFDFTISNYKNGDGNLTERFRITDAGNVGIGTTSPAKLLDVRKTDALSQDFIRFGDVSYFGVMGINGSGFPYLNSAGSSTKYIVVSNTGLGVNTTPSYPLQVAGTGAGVMASFGYSSYQAYIGVQGNGYPWFGDIVGNPVYFRTSDIDRMAIAANGLVGVNILSSIGSQLHVVTSSSSTKGLIVQGASSQSANLQEWQNSSATVLSSINSVGTFTVGSSYLKNAELKITATGQIIGDDTNQAIIFSGNNMTFQGYGSPVFTFRSANDTSKTLSIYPETGSFKGKIFEADLSTVDVIVRGWNGDSGTAGRAITLQGGNSGVTPNYPGGNAGNVDIRTGLQTDNTLGNEGTRGVIKFSTYTSGSSPALTERVRIDANGNVGIGTSTPQGRLDITTTATNDDVNYWYQQARVATTDATVTTLDTFAITASRTYVIDSRVIGRRTGGAAGTADDGVIFHLESSYTTKAGVVTLLGSATIQSAQDNVNVLVEHTISGTNVLVRVTGDTNNNYVWHSTSTVSWVGT